MLILSTGIYNSPECLNVYFIVQIFLCETLPMEYRIVSQNNLNTVWLTISITSVFSTIE